MAQGRQLFVEARVRASNWTDKQGEKQYDHSLSSKASASCARQGQARGA